MDDGEGEMEYWNHGIMDEPAERLWKASDNRRAKTEGELLYWGEEKYSIEIFDFQLSIAEWKKNAG